MVKHVILWKLKETDAESLKKIKADAKRELEALNGRIEGLVDIKIITEPLASSNADMMLDSTFTDANALAGYQAHPLHMAAANGYVRPFAQTRLCLDFEI